MQSNSSFSNNLVITQSNSIQLLIKRFPQVLFYSVNSNCMLKVNPSHIIPLLIFLKKHSLFFYQQLICISVIDHPKRKFRFEVVYHLLSLAFNKRIYVNVNVFEGKMLESSSTIFFSAGWYEREIWDIFGLFFYNHINLRRILTDYGFKGHPLRKDFPLAGFVEVKYDFFTKSITYGPESFFQEYRNYF